MNVEGQHNPKDVECIPVESLEVLPSGADWQSRHLESERRKAEIRDRIHKQAEQGQKTAKDYFRPAKPTPSIYDSDLKRVAVYARVSTSSEEQISSIENQTLYYTKKIAETENWNLQDIYSDEGKSGTSLRKRDAFKRMMRDAKDQKMDLIICASISRFARNFSDCMTQISALKTMHPAHPIGVYFETENIYTLNPNSQYNLDIQALLADWESGNKSRRMILSYDQRIMTGQYPIADLMGYRHTKDGQLVIEPEEANIGNIRETFFANQLKKSHQVTMSEASDFLVDGIYTFEIGGKRKGYSQIEGIPNGFIVADDIEIGFGNKIPLWMMVFLY